MCGICGMSAPVDRAALEAMVRALDHRGPNDSGTAVCADGEIGLGSTRLSILDLSPAGHMPMSSADGRVVVAYNGEIYNYRALRRTLEAAGHVFLSQTDTEVLVHGYEEWGRGLAARLNGMFAFAVWDDEAHELLLARDRFGIKPLYTWQNGDGRLLFASEVKALIAGGYRRGAVEPGALLKYLTFLWVPGPDTMFSGVQKLEPASYGVWRGGKLEVTRYWQPEFRPGETPDAEAPARLRGVLEDVMQRQLVSDVPVGVFLSGGLDSTALSALATCTTDEPVDTFTIAFRHRDRSLEQSSDDAKYARLAAETLGATLHEIEVAPQAAELLPAAVWHLDEPVADPAAITTWLICQAARDRVTVLLSGQGADEVFAGYRVHLMPEIADRMRLLPASARHVLQSRVVAAMPGLARNLPFPPPGLTPAAHRYLNKMLSGVDLCPDQRYVAYRSYFQDGQLAGLFSADMRATLADEVAGSEHMAYLAEVSGEDYLNRMLYLDWKTFLPELNLAYCDKMSMAASVETRVPYLDNEVVDLMLTVSPSMKLRGLTSKYVLREAVKDIVPSSILRRRKAGFGAPVRTWLRGDLREMVDDLLGAERIEARGYFDPAAIRKLIDEDRRGVVDHTYTIWALLNLEVWHEVFSAGAVT